MSTADTPPSPRGNFEALKGKVPQEVWSRCFRARGAHINALEGFPLFAAAMVSVLRLRLAAGELLRRAADRGKYRPSPNSGIELPRDAISRRARSVFSGICWSAL